MRCFKSRWAISKAADDGGAIPDAVRSHIETCADCEAFERRTEWLGRTLSSARSEAPRPAEPTRLPRHLAAAGLVAAGAIAIVLLVGNDDTPRKAPAVSEVDAVDAGEPEDEPLRLDVKSLAADAEGGIRYVLRVSGLPEPR